MVCDVFLCMSCPRSRLLSALFRLCAAVAGALSSERLQRSSVPAYLALSCQHVQQPVVLLTARPQHSLGRQQQQPDVQRWTSLRCVRREGEAGWSGVRVQYHSCLENVDTFLLSVAREAKRGLPPRLLLIDELPPPAQRAASDVSWQEAWTKSEQHTTAPTQLDDALTPHSLTPPPLTHCHAAPWPCCAVLYTVALTAGIRLKCTLSLLSETAEYW